jgi:hypothetical protein
MRIHPSQARPLSLISPLSSLSVISLGNPVSPLSPVGQAIRLPSSACRAAARRESCPAASRREVLAA